jgi:hypothetical protein
MKKTKKAKKEIKKRGPKPMPEKRKINMSFCTTVEVATFLSSLQNRSDYITEAVKYFYKHGITE